MDGTGPDNGFSVLADKVHNYEMGSCLHDFIDIREMHQVHTSER